MKESINFLKNLNIDKNKKLVVATSGGPDSMVLLYVLKNNGYDVVCAHVNHNLRKVSDDEYIFVENYCNDNNIIFEGMKIDCYKNDRFTEEEARIKRYDFFEKVLNKYDTDILLTAHHGDDLIETVLMRLIRGSNLNGYKGFSKIAKYKNFTILRPLIFYTKNEIMDYINENNIPCVYDESNNSKKYRRNRIRLDILPVLKEEDNNIHNKFLKFSENMEEVYNYFEKVVDNKINELYDNNELDLDKFILLDSLIQKMVIEKILFNIYNNDITLVNNKHVDNIINLINSSGNTSINLPNNIVVKKRYNKLILCKDCGIENVNYEYVLDNEVCIPNFGTIQKIEDTQEKSNYILKLNSRDINLPLIVRNKRDGDLIEVKNLNGKKKVKNIFVDEKVCKDIRDSYPILTDSDGNVLWIPGIKKSKFDCYNKEFYDIIIKYIKKGDGYEKE